MSRRIYLQLSYWAFYSSESSTRIIDITKNAFNPYHYCWSILIWHFKICPVLWTAHCWSNVILIVRLILSGNSGDSLTEHRDMPFTTRDQDNDKSPTNFNCAIKFKGAWWYTRCHKSNLNGLYRRGNHSSYADGVNWKDWKGYHYSLKRTEMKIRPVGFWTVMIMAQQWNSANLTVTAATPLLPDIDLL